MNWEAAACRGASPALFFPEQGASQRAAREVCEGCPVRVECLEEALSRNEQHGIWGGLSERERRKVKKARRVQR